MPDQETADFRPTPARESSKPWLLVAVLACAIAAGAAWWFWWRPAQMPVDASPVVTAPPLAVKPPASAAPAPLAEASGPLNPVDTLAAADAALPSLAQSDARVIESLDDLLGREKVLTYLLTDGFVRRVVATVDNLGRAHAAPRLWPVQPTPERFVVDGPTASPDPTIVAASNAARYTPLVAFAEAVPLEPAVAVYGRLYPLFQQAYEELGYPKGYFNDRLVAVLDHLLQAPEPQGPLRVKLTPVKTDLTNLRPWVRYEYVDPALEALSSGQKIMVRMGPENAQRAKVVIRQFRQRVGAQPLGSKVP